MINEIFCMFFKIEIFILACIQIRAKSNDGKMNLNERIFKLAGKTYIIEIGYNGAPPRAADRGPFS